MQQKFVDGPQAFITVVPSGLPNMGPKYVQESIWFGRQWSSTIKTFLDALIHGLLTGGVFGWLM